MEEKARIFWEEFQKIKDSLMDIDSLDDALADELLNKLDKLLKEYSLGVEFILSDLTLQGRELILTAYGDEEFFEDVIMLTQNAPVMDFWSVNAFLKPEGKGAKIEYEGLKLNSRDLFFLPLESELAKDKIGLKVAGRNFKKTDDSLSACYLLCEKMIGEYNATTLIDYFDADSLPQNYEQEGYLPLDYLPDFVEWKIEQMEAKSE